MRISRAGTRVKIRPESRAIHADFAERDAVLHLGELDVAAILHGERDGLVQR